MTKDEVVKAFYETRNREAMAHLLMRLRRLDVDRALFLLEGFAEKVDGSCDANRKRCGV